MKNSIPVRTIKNDITLPHGYQRIPVESCSFAAWLRNLPLKKDGALVHLYDNTLKNNQSIHEAVINLDVGNRDLQQCADAVMRLRGEYLFSQHHFRKIHFKYTNGENISFSTWMKGNFPKVIGDKVQWVSNPANDNSYGSFRRYMDNIFMYAGSASLSGELISIPFQNMHIGDVLIIGGHPGHAVIVLDMAVNIRTGEKIFIIAQSFMPAQEMHILKNLSNNQLSPWYSLKRSNKINTPEWTFDQSDLKRFSVRD